jgi:hypothetical protein
MGTGRHIAFATALIVFSQLVAPVPASPAALIVVAQSGPAQAPGTSPAADPNAAREKSPAESAPAAGTTSKARAVARAALAVPACSMRYVAAKISGKLNGRKWSEYRRDECGAKDTRAVFPAAVAPKYSGEDPDKARTLTCADQFTANKATDANAGMKWIDKDGGYYAECVTRLKG